MRFVPHLVVPLLAVLFLTPPAIAQPAAESSAWKVQQVPAIWKKAAGGRDAYSWYRCAVEVPESWADEELTLFIEGVDDAREVFFNGTSIGLVGTLPPEYRSGLGATMRFPIQPNLVSPGAANVVAVRVYQNQGRGGFNVAAPVLFGNDKAIRMAGDWETREGDDVSWGKLSTRDEIAETARFAKLESAADVEASLKKLDDDAGRQSIADTLKQLTHPDDLALNVAVGEPNIGQPLSIKWDARGRMWVIQYLQYPTIAGLKMISRDKFLRSVYDKVPPPPPHHFIGADKITIHEDTDGDGVYDKHKPFIEGLNLASSVAIGRGGVYVLNPPYLLFYPDADGDDLPDGDPEVLLEGFGLEDSHSVANSLRWGPDGWLYSTQGSTVTGHVRKPGSAEEPIHSMGQVVWRYHPESARYEIFAEGGGNSFGVEFDSQGRLYSGHNGGDTRGFHYVQGGYYRKGFGKHGSLSNPYTYGYFEAMGHAKVARFTHTFVIYEGDGLPAKYQGNLFGCGPLQSHIVRSEVQPDRSSVQTVDLGFALESEDKWVRPVDIQAGPDGGLYVVDMYEQRIDHPSHYQGRIDRESGRVYRLQDPAAKPFKMGDLSKLSTAELVDLLKHPNKWHRQTALRLLGDRRDAAALPLLNQMLKQSEGVDALNALWGLNLSGGFDDATASQLLGHSEPLVREWTVRLLGDRLVLSDALAKQLASLAASESDVRVRSQLAASARRMPAAQSLPVIAGLLTHDEDVDDIHVPLLIWWALEAHCEADGQQVLAMFNDSKIWTRPIVQQHLLERLMRRFASTGTRGDLLKCATLLNQAPAADQRATLLVGFESAFEGRSLSGLPSELLDALAKSGGGSLALRLRQGNAEAIEEALADIANKKVPAAKRIELIRIFGDIRNPAALPVLLKMANQESDEALVGAVLATLQSYDAAEIGETIVAGLNKYSDAATEVALSTLASRAIWSQQLLSAVASKQIEKDQIPTAILRKMLLHQNAEISEAIGDTWGEISGASTANMLAEITRISEVLSHGTGNPYDGKLLYKESCGKCHQLFEQGGEIGPDLTAYKRDDVRQLLVNVANPNLEIREGFENMMVLTFDGRALNGFVEDQDNQVVVIKGADGQRTVIEKENIDLMQASKNSLMPEDLLAKMSDQQLRDLFAYLRSTQPLP
ncbi:PVC-type heme-binding CxxCH protein [Rosistilla oblonga]|uniref:Glycosyl hydrolases family 2, sugar binding domain n=1 Tax=Rosistilla oblonga TaxID=2527990 RepID=A0A518IR29_9BACT|nr:PVC-type heme-binding CxxCH protein [Rosistilla oblonga]QDV55530.1 Glycosyl hydrolases family 2, sugar binding domain [Rosistilla oblonga]